MKIDDTKALLAKYRELDFEKGVVKHTLSAQYTEEVQKRLNTILSQLEILDKCLGILNPDEMFIIKNRILLNKKWESVVELYKETFGQENAKAERTLKHIQANALEKIYILIVKTNTMSYLDDIFHTDT